MLTKGSLVASSEFLYLSCKKATSVEIGCAPECAVKPSYKTNKTQNQLEQTIARWRIL